MEGLQTEKTAALRERKNAAETQIIMKKSYSGRSGPSTIADAKVRINIHDLWRHFEFYGEAKSNCHSPFRDDFKPSFSVNDDGTLWYDFGTGDGGDTVDFFQRATGLSEKAACRKFIEFARGHISICPRAPRSQHQPQTGAAKPMPDFPCFTTGTSEDIQQLAALRQISPEGLKLASERDLLQFATLKIYNAWVVTDSARVNAQARRMDGQTWEHLDGHPKAYTLPGSWASWPIGITETQPFQKIALCEGGPDLLAACHLIYYEFLEAQCSAVAMLGSTQRIHADALPMFADKRVRIFGHDDDAGRAAVDCWARQLSSVGADVDAFNFAGLVQVNGKPVKDLNDSLLMDSESFAQVGRMLPL
jgi:hypothetical protein